MVWPYNDLRVGSPISKVLTPVVVQGGELEIENPSFCIDDQDVTVERWAEILDEKGAPIGALQIFDLKYLLAGRGLFCQAPAIGRLTLPNYIIGPDGTAAEFRLHSTYRYMGNFVNEVEVETWSETFIVVPEEMRTEDER
jgi:hypothetical protein